MNTTTRSEAAAGRATEWDALLAQFEDAYRDLGLTPAQARRAALADCTRPVPKHGATPRWLVIAAFAAVFVIWGSTYLVIRFAIETIPPFLMAGSRFLVAGVCLYALARFRGAAKPRPVEWRDATVVGALLLFIGNGGVTWAEQTVPSGVTALIVALIPLWVVVIDWLRSGGTRPGKIICVGLAMGFTGVALIVSTTQPGGGRMAEPLSATVLILASIAWSIGSVFSRHARKPGSPLLMVSMQMIAGGVLLLLAGLGTNEIAGFRWSALSAKSLLAWTYLTIAGSAIAFTAYRASVISCWSGEVTKTRCHQLLVKSDESVCWETHI